MVEDDKYFDFEFHRQVIRYIPRGERRHIEPPPPPPTAIFRSRRNRQSFILPSINPIPPPPPISFTNNPLNLLDNDEEEIPILPEIQEDISNENEETTNIANTPLEVTPNARIPILPEIRNYQQSIRSALSFGNNTNSSNVNNNIINMSSPFRPSRELPRSPNNRVIRRNFNIFG